MQLEFTKTEIRQFRLVCAQTVSREETLEMIVPDACPDMVQVTDTYGFCALTERELTDTGAVLSGRVRVTVLYTPEGAPGLRRLEAELPFQHVLECDAAGQDCRLLAEAVVASAETRMINPRKILIRVDLREQMRVCCPEPLSLCSGLLSDEAQGVEQRVEHYQASFVTACAEKEFPLEETLSLPGGRVTAEVLRLQAAVSCRESRLIGSKLVLKGSALLRLLCQGEDGALYPADFDLPFSQMLESGGAGEGALADLSLQVLDWELGALAPDGRQIPISLELSAQAVFYETLSAGIVTDAYSTYFPAALERKSRLFQRTTDPGAQRQVIREFAALEAPGVRTICDSHLELGAVQVRAEGERWTVSVPAMATVLYQDEEGRYGALRHRFSVSLQQPGGAQTQMTCRCACGRVEALPAAAGVELRGAVEFRLHAVESFEAEEVVRLELDTDHPTDHEGQPSVVLRRPEAETSLWEIAKRYGTTCREICAANGIPEDQPLGTQMLLIPRKR